MVPGQATPVLRGSFHARARVVVASHWRMSHAITAGVLPLGVLDARSALAAVEETVAPIGAPDAISLLQDYPVAAGALALVIFGGTAIAASSLGKPRSKPTGAVEAFEALQTEERTVLVDLRPKSVQKEEGLIDLKEANKKVLRLAYAEPDADGDLVVDPDFATKLQQLAGVGEQSIVILIDSDGSLAPMAAADAAKEGFFTEKIYWVRGGVEGPKGWKANNLPTKAYRVFELSLPSLELPVVDLSALAAELQAQVPGVDLSRTVDKVSGAVTTLTDKYKENPTLGNALVAVAGITAVGAFAITELEAIVQVVGALGVARFLATNLLFAKDREATFAALKTFLKDHGLDGYTASGSSAGGAVAPGVGGELRQLANIVLGARDSESAAKQITEQMVPKIEGVDSAALAAALSAAGVELRMPAPEPVPAGPAVVLEPVAEAAPGPEVLVMAAAVVAEREAPLRLEAAEVVPEPSIVATAAAAAGSAKPSAVMAAGAGAAGWKEDIRAAAAAVASALEPASLEPAPRPAPALDVPEAAVTVAAHDAPLELEAAVTVAAHDAPLELEAAATVAAHDAPLELEAAATVAAHDAPLELEAAATVAAHDAPLELEAAAQSDALDKVTEGGVDLVPGSQAVPSNAQESRSWITSWTDSGASAVTAAEDEQPPMMAGGTPSPILAAATEARAGVQIRVPWSREEGAVEAGGEVAEVAGVAPNVLQAREWIAAWKSSREAALAAASPAVGAAPPEPTSPVQETKQLVETATGPSHGVVSAEAAEAVEHVVASNVQEAREWIAAWKSTQKSQQSLVVVVESNDGTPYAGPVIVGGDGASDSYLREALEPEPSEAGAAAKKQEVAVVVNVPA